MKETWNYKLIDLLKKARIGNTNELNEFLNKYSDITAVNEDFSAMLLFRYFNVQHWNDERRILNCHPEDEYFQKGITIVQSADDGGSESRIYLPNKFDYKLNIKDKEIEIVTNEKSITTNITELFRKSKFFKRSITEQEIENGFNSLCNEQYEKPKQPEVKHKTIELPSFGILVYDEKVKWYKCNINVDQQNIDLTISLTTPEKLEKVIAFADKQMKAKFYEQVLLGMEPKMIALKNDAWLGEDEETGEDEPPITADEFRKRISIDSIGFDEDCSCSIYCNDDDIFFGHQIEIDVDENGNYKDANLVG